jgi:hypothetical protein
MRASATSESHRAADRRGTEDQALSQVLVRLLSTVRQVNRIAVRMDRKLGRRLRKLESLRP